jgi:hypothetical protein
MVKRNFVFALVAGAGVTIAGPGLAAELLANGNFETGTFAGWSTVDTGGGAANSYFVIPNGGNLPASGQGTQVNPGGGNFVAWATNLLPVARSSFSRSRPPVGS